MANTKEAELEDLREQLAEMREILFSVCVKDASESDDGKPCWCPASRLPTPATPHCSECLDARKIYFG